jgi:fibronectin-binding autotransporter adhesin
MKNTLAKFTPACIAGAMLLFASIGWADTANFTNVGTYTWTVPAGVSSVQIQCWGGGGAGGGGNKQGNNTVGAGGGGGAYALQNITVSTGNSYTLFVGGGGTATASISANGSAAAGTNSWFGTATTTNCLAAGGFGAEDVYNAGYGNSTNGPGGPTNACIGTTLYRGGNGGTCGSHYTGAGGSGAGSGGQGADATTYTAGTPPTGGGTGESGYNGAASSGGGTGTAPGGAGAGGGAYNTGTHGGGSGAAGRVILTYTVVYNSVNVETKADGTGSIVPAQDVSVGNSITVYAIGRASNGTFMSNTPAIWSLVNQNGNVANTDLVPSSDGKSAVFTAHLSGSANIQAVAIGATGTTNVSGTITVPSTGVTATWDVDSDGDWSSSGNWSGGSVPSVAGDTAILGIGSLLRTITLDANESLGTLAFTNANSFVISGTHTLTMDGSGNGAHVTVTGGSTNAAQTPVALNDNTTVSVDSGDSLMFSGAIANTSSAKTLAFNGAGTNILSAANSYGPSSSGTVGTVLSGGGVLQVGNNTSLGAGDLTNLVSSTLQPGVAGLILANNIGIAPSVTMTVNNNGNSFALGGVISGSGGITAVGNGTVTLSGVNTYTGSTTISSGTLAIGGSGQLGSGSYAGAITNNSTLNYGSTAAQTLSGVISGSGALNQTGTGGTLTLSGTNTFSGVTTISAGTLMLGNALALQNSVLNYNNQGGTLDFGSLTAATLGSLSGAQSLSLLNDSAASVALTVGGNNGSTTFSGTLTGNGLLNKVGTGVLTLANPGYTSNTVVFNGGLTITGGSLTSHLDLSAQQGVVNTVISGGSVTSPNGVYITSSTGGSGTIYGNLATLTVTNGAQLTANADANGRAISYGMGNGRPGGNASLTIGTTGGTTTLVTANGVLDMFYTSGGSTVGNFTVNLNGGTLAVDRIQESTYSANQTGTFKFNGGTLKALAGDGTALFIPATPSQLTWDITTNGAIIDANGYNITIGAVLYHGNTNTFDGGLTKIGNGTLTLTNANQYTGGTTVKAGTLAINGFYALGGANYGGLIISNGATLQYVTNFIATGNGSGDLSYISSYGGSITFGAGGGVIDLNGNNVTYAGSVGNGGSGGLSLQSTVSGGVLTLSASNNYTGSTAIGNGVTLIVNNTNGSAAGSGNVTVASGGTLDDSGIISGNVTVQGGGTLAGNGIVGGTLEIQNTGILTPGDSGVGTNTVGALTLDSGAIANIEFSDTANDMTVVTNSGGLTVNGGVFNLYQAGGTLPWTTTGTYNLIRYNGTAPTLDSSWTTASGSNPHIGNLQANFLYSFHPSGGYLTVTIALSGSVVSGTWTNDVNGNWSTAANWSSNPSVPHSAGDLAVFGAGTALRTVTLDANETVGTLTMNNNNSFVIANSGKTLTVNNGGSGVSLYVTGGTANQINTAIALSDNLNATVSGGKSLTISANIANTGSAKTLTVNSPGTVALSGNNSYGPGAGTYGTFLTGGATLQVGSSTALGAGDVSFAGNGTLQAGVSVGLNNNIDVSPGVTATVDSGGNNLALNGVISDSGNLAKTGNGTLALPDNVVNTYTGGTIVSGGVLSIAYEGDVYQSTSINLNGGDLLGNGQADQGYQVVIDPPIGIGPTNGTVAGTALIDATSGTTLTLNGLITSAGNTGANNLVVNSGAGNNGTVYMGIDGNTFNGTTAISNGLLWVASSLPLAYSTLNYSNQGGYLVVDGGIGAITLGGLSGGQNLGLTNLNGGGLTLTVGNNNNSTTYSGNLNDYGLNGGLTKVGTGTLTLSGTNSYNLATTISGGLLQINTNGVLDTLSANVPAVGGAGLVVSGGTLTVTNASTIGNPSAALRVSSGSATFLGGLSVNSAANGAYISVTGGSLALASLSLGRTGLSDTTQPTAGSTGDGLYINGGAVNILGNLNMGTASAANSSVSTRIDSGSLTVGGAVYIGLNNGGRWSVLDVNGGSLMVTDVVTGISIGNAQAGDAELLIRNGTVNAGIIGLGYGTVADTVVLNMTNGALYVGGGGIVQVSTGVGFVSTITLSGGILGAGTNWTSTNNMQLGSATIQTADALGNPWNIGLSGILSGTNLLKSGAGTLTLGGANTYGGSTVVSNGVLALAVTGLITNTAQVSIASNATFDVSALTGYTFSGASPVQTLAGISTSGEGNVNATGNALTLAAGAKVLLQAAGGTNSPSIGKISVTGDLGLNANVITINVGGGILGTGTYRLLDCTGTLSGTANATPVFTGLGATPGATVSISTTTGAGGHVDLVVGKATPVLQAATATSILAGQALSASALTVTFTNAAGTNVPGSAVFTAPGTMPAVGTANQQVLFTPNDTTDYNTVTFNVAVTVISPVLIPTQSAGITGFSLENGNVVITGTNGQTGGTYYLLESTNLALPVGQWKAAATNVVGTNGANGAFTFTGTNAAGAAGQSFYILSNTNN